jgi:hypothetical protein
MNSCASLSIMLLILISLFSCDKGEIPVPPRVPGDVITANVEMGSDYRNVIYYNLLTQTIVHSHLKTDWDLGFETGSDGSSVILNTSKAMAAATTDQIWLKNVSSDNNAEYKRDMPSGNLDSTAIGDWKNTNKVFIIDRGYNISGGLIGKIKIRIEETALGYRIHYAGLADMDSSSFEFELDDALNFVSISLEGSGLVADIEPLTQDWHLKFTQYTHIFVSNNELIPYTVTGVLINPYQIKGCLQSEVLFDSVDVELATTYIYSDSWNVIGYDWKTFDLNSGNYTVFPDMVYLLENLEGINWKLHFIDFYNENGDKGSPTFEYQEL